jgi:Transcriptional regulatory protein, C terminal
MSHVGHALDRQTILNQVWGYDFLGETNIIEVYVRYLREKIEVTQFSSLYPDYTRRRLYYEGINKSYCVFFSCDRKRSIAEAYLRLGNGSIV